MFRRMKPAKPTTIVVTERHNVFQACIKDSPEIWEAGATRADAIGKLIIARAERFFGITIQIEA